VRFSLIRLTDYLSSWSVRKHCRISLVGRSAPLRCAQTKMGKMRSSSVPEYLDNAPETTGVFGARDSDPRLSAASSSYPQRSSFAIPGLPGLARSLSFPWEVASGCTLRSAESCFEPPSSLSVLARSTARACPSSGPFAYESGTPETRSLPCPNPPGESWWGAESASASP
jgi:hypothetical protein